MTLRQLSRAATISLFLLNGMALAAWVSNIPTIQVATGVSKEVLGGLLLVLGVGAIVGMQIAGLLVDRVGSRGTAMVAALLLILSVNPLGLVSDAGQLGLAIFVFGLGNGALDVAMNDQAVRIERVYRRPIMSSFHAFFSVGGAVGAGITAVLQASRLSVHWPLAVISGLCLVLAVLSFPHLISGVEKAEEESSEPVSGPAAGWRRRAVVLGILAFLLMLAEGSANDWSALHAVEERDQPEHLATLAYAAFALAMTIGRFTADTISHCFGSVTVVRGGSILSTIGMAVVVLTPVYPLTLAGWVIFGLGLSGIVPQIFTAAGNINPRNQGVIMSRIVGAGYVGILAGPAVIGWLAGGFGLNIALVLPLILCAVAIVLAGQVGSPDSRGSSSV